MSDADTKPPSDDDCLAILQIASNVISDIEQVMKYEMKLSPEHMVAMWSAVSNIARERSQQRAYNEDAKE